MPEIKSNSEDIVYVEVGDKGWSGYEPGQVVSVTRVTALKGIEYGTLKETTEAKVKAHLEAEAQRELALQSLTPEPEPILISQNQIKGSDE